MLLLVALFACHHADDTDTDVVFEPELHCPDDPSGVCDDVPGAPLEAGVAVASIVPDCWEAWTDADGDRLYDTKAGDAFLDCGCDRLCPGDDGYVAADEGEGDGVFQARWMAGSSNGRPMTRVRSADEGLRGADDGIWARAVALRQGNTTLVWVTLDVVGYFNNDVLTVRQRVADAGIDVDHLVVQATHDHDSIDTMGMWGKSPFSRGYDDEYAEQVRTTVVEVVGEAVGALRPVATMTVGGVHTSDYAASGVANFIHDDRDPWVVDDELQAVRLADADGESIVTLVHWANHPETMLDDAVVSSDYVHALRETVEDGVTWTSGQHQDGVGGEAVYVEGTLGGMMSPLHATTVDPDGNVWDENTFEKADAIGQMAGGMALDALASGETVDDPRLDFRKQSFYLPIDNIGFQALSLSGVLVRDTYHWDPSREIDDDNIPELLTELDVVDLGPVQIMTIPGEVLPELAVGGYDGSQIHADGVPLVDPANENPPDLAAAPVGPYWKDEMTGDYRWIAGLGNDELGYMIPEYDFVVADGLPYLEEAPGDHYEETNSLGPRTAGLVGAQVGPMLSWEP